MTMTRRGEGCTFYATLAVVVIALIGSCAVKTWGQCAGGDCAGGSCGPAVGQWGGAPGGSWRASPQQPWNVQRPQQQPAPIQKANPAIVKVWGRHGSSSCGGTGAIVARDGTRAWVLTCYHTFADGGTPIIVAGGYEWQGVIEAKDPKADLLLIRIADPGIAPIYVAEQDVAPGAAVEAGGYGEGLQRWTWSQRQVVRKSDALEVSGAARQGDSGAPILSCGKVVGVLYGTDRYRVTYATPLGPIQRLLRCLVGAPVPVVPIVQRERVIQAVPVVPVVPVQPRPMPAPMPQTQPPPAQPPTAPPPAATAPQPQADWQAIREEIAALRAEIGNIKPVPGKDGRDGIDGKPGRDGVDGAPGRDAQVDYDTLAGEVERRLRAKPVLYIGSVRRDGSVYQSPQAFYWGDTYQAAAVLLEPTTLGATSGTGPALTMPAAKP